MAKRSYDTAGLESTERRWIGRLVRVKSHPEWGVTRVARWYPSADGKPERLRVIPLRGVARPQLAETTDTEIIEQG